MAKKHKDLLETALQRLEQSRQAESDLRETATDNIKFAHGEQWDKLTLEERHGRPNLVVNRIAGTNKQIKGDQRKVDPSIKVRPMDSAADPETAKIINGLIRNVEYTSNADTAYNTAFDFAVDCGWGFFRIDTDYADEDTFEQDICIKRITNPFAVYIDPSYTELDASDIDWAFITEVMDQKDFKKRYPKAEANSSDFDQGKGEDHAGWWTDEQARVAEYFYKEPVKRKLYQLATGDVMSEDMIDGEMFEVKDLKANPQATQKSRFIVAYDEHPVTGEMIPAGYFQVEREREVDTHKVMWCLITSTEVIDGPREFPSRYIPIVLVPGDETYIDGERKMVSAHHHAKDAQRVYNWSVSTAVETVAQAPKQPWLVTPDMIQGFEKIWNQAHRKPMPYLPYNPDPDAQGPPSRQQGAIPDSGATQERMQAADDIKATTGIYDASLGAQGGEQSGRQVQLRQEEGDVSSHIFFDNLAVAMRHAGRIIVDLIPYIYDSERIVRILGPDGTEQFAEVNKMVIDMESGEAQTLNDVTQGKYDVIIDIGPSYPTRRAEAADKMIEFVRAFPQLAPLMMDLIAKHQDWPGADEIYERLQQAQQQQGQGQQMPPEQQLDLQQKQLGLEKDMLDIENKEMQQAKDFQDMARQADEMEQPSQEMLEQVAQRAAMETARQYLSGSGNTGQRQQQQQRQRSPRQAQKSPAGGAR